MGWLLFSLIDYMMHKVCSSDICAHVRVFEECAISARSVHESCAMSSVYESGALYARSVRNVCIKCCSCLPPSTGPVLQGFGTKRYTSKVDANIQEAFRSFSKKQYKD
jgi:hypothetical protein